MVALMTFVIDETVEIDAPAEVVWKVLTDFASYGEWNPFVLRCSTTLEPGAPIDMRVRLVGPKAFPQREYIRDHIPGVEFGYRMKPVPGGTLHSHRTHTVTPLGDGRCRYRSHFELAGWLQPVVTALLGTALRRGFGGMTAAVASRAESVS